MDGVWFRWLRAPNVSFGFMWRGGWFLELVQQDKPTLVYVNPSIDPDAFDVWQTHPNEGARWQVGRTRADNSDSGQKR